MKTNRILRFILLIITFGISNNFYGQETENVDPGESEKKFIIREKEYEEAWLRDPAYVDGDPDTLYFFKSEFVSDGRYHFFRRTPLCLKKGWTNIFSDDEVDFTGFISFPPTNNNGKKGYTLTWLYRNDSLYLKDVTLRLDKGQEGLPRDEIISRIEAFTQCKFENGLMFIDWISGDLGLVTRHTRIPRERYRNSLEYSESYNNGFLITFDKGKSIYVRADVRENKH
ncbi:MAG: hypothetical protein WCZ43_01985 [Proteiniphilum sp.]